MSPPKNDGDEEIGSFLKGAEFMKEWFTLVAA
jgi:hypothetical protein